jgi:hypothetical protein
MRTKRRPRTRRVAARTTRKENRTSAKGDGLTEAQRLFVAEYITNLGNGVKAYLASHPACRSYHAAGVEAHRTLKNPKVSALIKAAREERWHRLEMQGAEAIALISIVARANIADAFDERGNLLAPHLWPDTLSLAVKRFQLSKDGSFSIILHDGLRAAELIAIATGRLKQKVGVAHTFDHVRYLAGAEEPWSQTR